MKSNMHPSRILLLPAWLSLLWLHTSETHGTQIPASMLMEMAKMNSTREFMLHMVVNRNRSVNVQKGSVEDLLFTEKGAVDLNGVDSAASQVASPQGCAPAMRPVNLPTDPDPTVVYFPSCVSLQRCGGCCASETLECGPSQASTETVSVVRTRYPGQDAEYLEYDGIEQIALAVHLACECRCKVQPYHCKTTIQVYEPEECRCKCKNEDQATSCPVKQKWDESKCSCVCANTPDCLHGEVFRTETCSCENTTPAPPSSNVYDPCARKNCPAGYQKQKVSAYSCRCEFASTLPRRSRSLGPRPRQHITDRFPMMRAGIFDRR